MRADFHERHNELHGIYAQRFAELVSQHNQIRASASDVLAYRDLMDEIADSARAVAAAADEVVIWMGDHDVVRESIGRG